MHACNMLILVQGLKTDKPEEQQVYEGLQAELLAQWPQHLPLLQERLTRLDKLEGEARQPKLQVSRKHHITIVKLPVWT